MGVCPLQGPCFLLPPRSSRSTAAARFPSPFTRRRSPICTAASSATVTASVIPRESETGSAPSRAMDPAEHRYLEEDDTPLMKTIKGATTGFAAGTIWGTVVATWHDVPRVERNVALPGLLRTLRMMGGYGATFAAIGGVFIGVEQLLQHQRMKRDFINGAVGGFVAGAAVLGYRGRSITTAIQAGSALAITSSLIDIGGQTTRIDNGKEYYPYTTQKRPSVE